LRHFDLSFKNADFFSCSEIRFVRAGYVVLPLHIRKPHILPQRRGEIIIYQSEEGKTKIEVRLEDENVWLTQKMMAELFQTTPQNITLHLKNIFEEGELQEDATCKDFLQVQTEGSRKVGRKQKFYNLDVVISVGYRIKSRIATKFRIWATERLKEYMIKGFTMDDERLKQYRWRIPYYGANGILEYIDDYIFDGTFILVGEVCCIS